MLTKVTVMYIILSKSTSKTAVIKDKTEIAGYINERVRIVRELMRDNDRVEIKDFIIITPDYVQSKSNRGGLRQPNKDY